MPAAPSSITRRKNRYREKELVPVDFVDSKSGVDSFPSRHARADVGDARRLPLLVVEEFQLVPVRVPKELRGHCLGEAELQIYFLKFKNCSNYRSMIL